MSLRLRDRCLRFTFRDDHGSDRAWHWERQTRRQWSHGLGRWRRDLAGTDVRLGDRRFRCGRRRSAWCGGQCLLGLRWRLLGWWLRRQICALRRCAILHGLGVRLNDGWRQFAEVDWLGPVRRGCNADGLRLDRLVRRRRRERQTGREWRKAGESSCNESTREKRGRDLKTASHPEAACDHPCPR